MFFSPAGFIRLLATCLTMLLLAADLSAAGDDLIPDTIPPPPVPERPVIQERKGSEMFGGIREEMPTLSNCGDKPDYASRKKCSDSLLIAFIYDNLRYPYQAWRDSVEGFAVVSFAVEKDGSVSDTRIVRDPGTGTGREALRLVNLMNKRQACWIPGTQAGKPVRVQFNLPVKFKMADHKLPPPPPPPPPPRSIKENVQLATMLEEPPLFPGCEDLGTYQEEQECAAAKMEEFIQGNLRYPKSAGEKGVEGTVLVSYIVEKDGRVSNGKLLHDLGAGTGEEALRLVNLIGEKGLKFSPPQSGGRVPRVLYTLPVRFTLK